MEVIDINTWKRRKHFEHFSTLSDPYFAVTIPFNVSNAYQFSKDNGISFFAKYLHDCMKAINVVENLKYRIVEDELVKYDVIHASPTLMRPDQTFGFSFVHFEADLNKFIKNLNAEKLRIENSQDLYPIVNGLDCIHCSALPWFNFSGHKEPSSNTQDSVPKIAFSKMTTINKDEMMNVAISVNHALVDGYHVGLFVDEFQNYLNS